MFAVLKRKQIREKISFLGVIPEEKCLLVSEFIRFDIARGCKQLVIHGGFLLENIINCTVRPRLSKKYHCVYFPTHPSVSYSKGAC